MLGKQTLQLRSLEELQTADAVFHFLQRERRGQRRTIRGHEEVCNGKICGAQLRHDSIDLRLHEFPPRYRPPRFDVSKILLAADSSVEKLRSLVEIHRCVKERQQQRPVQHAVQQGRRIWKLLPVPVEKLLLLERIYVAANKPTDVVLVGNNFAFILSRCHCILARQLQVFGQLLVLSGCHIIDKRAVRPEVVFENNRPKSLGSFPKFSPRSFSSLIREK